MSETLALAPEREATEASVDNHEIKDPNWGSELVDFVSANQHVVVRCPWMGGAKVTLGEAMTTYSYPPNMTENDLPMVTVAVNELLANRVLEEEEPEEEEEKPAGDETSQEEENEKPEKTTVKIKKETPRPNQKPDAPADKPRLEPKALTVAAETESKKAKLPEQGQAAKTIATEKTAPSSPTQNKTARSVPTVSKAEVAARAETVTVNSTRASAEAELPHAINSNTPEAASAASATPETFVGESASNEVADGLSTESSSSPDGSEPAWEKFAEPFDAYEPPETTDDIEKVEIETPDLNRLDILEDFADSSGKNEISYEGLEAVIPNYEIMEKDLIDLAEPEEILIDHQEETILQPDGPLVIPEDEEAVIIQLDSRVEPLVQIEEDIPEQLAPNRSRIEEIEKSLIQVVERFETSEPQKVEVARGTLDEIMELAARLEGRTEKETITEEEAQGELEELFKKLFDQLDIEFTPELIQDLAHLTLHLHSAGQIKGEEVNGLMLDDGTHEIIRIMLSGAGNIKKALENAHVIGKYALWNYAYDFPTELRKRLAA